ncbi:MAG: hypothetical protein LBT12_07210 [Oscillospiraceae bacterium]|jgi:hypothetical protein|nr:hypothetical protein [Oscillospiraceae bacterium]
MKGTKTGLFLVELMISLLLFAYCAAICIQIFNAAGARTRGSENLSRGVFAATSAAEIYKSSGGDLEKVAKVLGGIVIEDANFDVIVGYDASWHAQDALWVWSSAYPSPPTYYLTLTSIRDGLAEIRVVDEASIRKADNNADMTPSEYDSAVAAAQIFSLTVKVVAS